MNKHMITLLSLLGVGVVFGSETAYGAKLKAEEMNLEVMKVNDVARSVVKDTGLNEKSVVMKENLSKSPTSLRSDGTEFERDSIAAPPVANERRTGDEFTVGVADVGTQGLHIIE